MTITEAKAWYDHNSNIAFRSSSQNKTDFKIRPLNWNKALNTNDHNYYVVESPVQFDSPPGFTFSDSKAKANAVKANDVARMLILKDQRNGKMRSALMHIVTDNGESENASTYGKINKDFSGYIFFTKLDGSFINGYEYKNGKIIRKSKKKTSIQKISKRISMNDALSVMAPPDPGICTTETTTVYIRDCTYYSTGEKVCTPWEVFDTFEVTYCSGGSGDGGGNGGDSYIEQDEPAPFPEPPSANKKVIDSLKNYPCAQDVLKRLPSINIEVDSIIHKIFGINEDVNLTFSVDNSLTKNSLDGYTKFPGGSASFFDSKIELNPWVLQNSTKEYILVTMLHEAIHSYIDYWYNQYLTKQIDSTTFKTRFPIFWNYKKILKDPVEIAQHNTMAENYITTMKNAIKSYNPNATDAAAEALAWGGLQETTVWKTKSDTTNAIIMNLNSRDAGLNKFSQYNFQKCGGISVE